VITMVTEIQQQLTGARHRDHVLFRERAPLAGLEVSATSRRAAVRSRFAGPDDP
jgi:hypothetical protein